jgi:hypothetical protein
LLFSDFLISIDPRSCVLPLAPDPPPRSQAAESAHQRDGRAEGRDQADRIDRCYDFLNVFAEKFSKKLAFLTHNKAKICKILIITLVFEKNANFFRRNFSKIAENCDQNIDPGLADFCLLDYY